MNEAVKENEEIENVEETEEVELVEESDIDLEIVDDTPEEDQNRRPVSVEDPSDNEIAEYSDKVQRRMKELTRARHDERRAKEAAQREKDEAATLTAQLYEENKKLRNQYNSGAKQYGEVLNSNAGMELEMARQKLRAAQENYDTDEIIKAQENLASAKFKEEQAKYFKPQALQEPNNQVYNRQTPENAVKLSDDDIKWQTRNPWFNSNQHMTDYAMQVHHSLVNSGVAVGTKNYYEDVDSRMRNEFPDYFGDARKEPKAKPATVVAAPSRTTGKKKITLTKSQTAIAKRLGLSNEQYAKEVLKLNSES